MVQNAEEFEGMEGLPGLLFPFVPHSIESGILQDSKDEMGGFPVYSVVGNPGKVWATKPASAEAVARVVEVTVGGTVARSDKFSVTIAGTKYEVTAGSGDDAADIASALATAVSADANYGASASTGKVTITASTAGAARNADQFVVDKTSTSGTIAKNEKTAGADAVEGGTFLGIASFTTADCMHLGSRRAASGSRSPAKCSLDRPHTSTIPRARSPHPAQAPPPSRAACSRATRQTADSPSSKSHKEGNQ